MISKTIQDATSFIFDDNGKDFIIAVIWVFLHPRSDLDGLHPESTVSGIYKTIDYALKRCAE